MGIFLWWVRGGVELEGAARDAAVLEAVAALLEREGKRVTARGRTSSRSTGGRRACGLGGPP
jgi:hypothetical protein